MASQVSVFLENKPGRLEDVSGVLGRNEINIRAMTLTTSSAGWGVLNLLVDRPRRAAELLRETGHSATLREIVVVRMSDAPGSLREVVAALSEVGLNIENAYGTVLRERESAILVVDVENVDRAEEALARAGVRTLNDDEIYST